MSLCKQCDMCVELGGRSTAVNGGWLHVLQCAEDAPKLVLPTTNASTNSTQAHQGADMELTSSRMPLRDSCSSWLP